MESQSTVQKPILQPDNSNMPQSTQQELEEVQVLPSEYCRTASPHTVNNVPTLTTYLEVRVKFK